MEQTTEDVFVEIHAEEISSSGNERLVSNVCINFFSRIEIFEMDESRETKTCTGFYPGKNSFTQINLDIHSYEDFSRFNLFSLINPHLPTPYLSLRLADKIAQWTSQDVFGYLRQPYRLFVYAVHKEQELVLFSSRRHPECEKDESTCPICLEDLFKYETMIVPLPCSHRFHLACIGKWLQKSRNSCPLCRRVVRRK